MGQLDNAAMCMIALSKTGPCSDNPVEDELCRVCCCCEKHPVKKTSGGRNQRQTCADTMLSKLRDTKDRPYVNSLEHVMKAGDSPDRPETYRDMMIDGTLQKGKIRIPDVSLFDENKKLVAIYDFKFSTDHWRDGQKEDYEILVGKNNVFEISPKTCNCASRKA